MHNPTDKRAAGMIPEPEGAQRAVFQASPIRVLYATDGSESSVAAARWLRLLPLPAGSAIRVVTVLETHSPQTPKSLKGAEREWGLGVLRSAEALLSQEEVHLSQGIVRGTPAREILKAADAFHANLIVVGSHGRTGLERFLLGSVAENVAKHASCPILVARKPQNMLRYVLLAVDGSEHSEHATGFCTAFPLPVETVVTVCHVYRRYYPLSELAYAPDFTSTLEEVWKQQQQQAEQLVAPPALRVEQSGKEVRSVIRAGDPAAELLNLQKEQQADLIIAGARGLSAIETFVLGSVADRLLHYADCSVLLVP